LIDDSTHRRRTIPNQTIKENNPQSDHQRKQSPIMEQKTPSCLNNRKRRGEFTTMMVTDPTSFLTPVFFLLFCLPMMISTVFFCLLFSWSGDGSSTKTLVVDASEMRRSQAIRSRISDPSMAKALQLKNSHVLTSSSLLGRAWALKWTVRNGKITRGREPGRRRSRRTPPAVAPRSSSSTSRRTPKARARRTRWRL